MVHEHKHCNNFFLVKLISRKVTYTSYKQSQTDIVIQTNKSTQFSVLHAHTLAICASYQVKNIGWKNPYVVRCLFLNRMSIKVFFSWVLYLNTILHTLNIKLKS